jgi:hypothetical protein
MLLNLHYYVVPRFAQVSYFYMQMTLSSTPRFDFPCENFLARVKKVLYTRDGLAYGGWILVYGIRAYSRLKARVKIGATWVGPSRCYRGGGGGDATFVAFLAWASVELFLLTIPWSSLSTPAEFLYDCSKSCHYILFPLL